jgi:Family of unknown function (DUF6221)
VTDDPVARLKAGLDKDEAAAKAWLPFGNPDAAAREHIARQDPGRVLRRVAADRKILARYEQAMSGDLPEWQAGRELLVAAAAILRGVIVDLAAAYGDDDA